MYNEYKQFETRQRMYVRKQLLNAITYVLAVASITRVLYETFDSQVLMLKDYLWNGVGILILIPFVSRWIRANPIRCYRIKGTVSVGGLMFLVMVELLQLPREWYILDAVIVALIPLVTMPHRAYYQSVVTNKCMDFSDYIGRIDMVGNVVKLILGVGMVYLMPEPVYVLILCTVMDYQERHLDLKIASSIWGESELIEERA